MNAHRVPLGELCEMDRRGIQPDDPLTADLPFVGVENVVGGTGILNFDTDSRIGGQRSTAFRFDRRHVLYGKLRPYLNKVAVPEFAGRCSTELVPLLPHNGVDRDFLAHLLRRKETVDFVMASVTGTRMPRTDMKVLMSMPAPFPPLDEQRRIAGILNRAARIEHLHLQAAKIASNVTASLMTRFLGDDVSGISANRSGPDPTIPRQVEEQLDRLCAAAHDEQFEIGVESRFSRELQRLCAYRPTAVLQSLRVRLIHRDASPEVLSEILHWASRQEADVIRSPVIELLSAGLDHPSSLVRDAAASALACLDERAAVSHLRQALERETVPELREDLEDIIRSRES